MRSNALHELVFHFYAGDITAVDEVTDVFVGILYVATVVALVIEVLVLSQQVGFGTVVFCSGKSEAVYAFGFAQNSL